MNANNTPSSEEIERMRAFLAAYDQNPGNPGDMPREFDLNNPPRVPYVYAEYPRMVYHHEQRETAVVHNPAQLENALKAGYRREAFSAAIEPEEEKESILDAESEREAVAVQKQLSRKK